MSKDEYIIGKKIIQSSKLIRRIYGIRRKRKFRKKINHLSMSKRDQDSHLKSFKKTTRNRSLRILQSRIEDFYRQLRQRK